MPHPSFEVRRARRMAMTGYRETTSGLYETTSRAGREARAAAGRAIDQELRARGYPVPDPGQDDAALELRRREVDLLRLAGG